MQKVTLYFNLLILIVLGIIPEIGIFIFYWNQLHQRISYMNNFSQNKQFWIGLWHKSAPKKLRDAFKEKHSSKFDKPNQPCEMFFLEPPRLTVRLMTLTRFISMIDGYNLSFGFQDIRRQIISLAIKVTQPMIMNTEISVRDYFNIFYF